MSLAAIALSIPILIGVLRGSQTIEDAAIRVIVLAVAVSVIDRHVAPLVMHVVHGLGRPRPGEDISP